MKYRVLNFLYVLAPFLLLFVSFSSAFLTCIANVHGVAVSRLEGFVSNREQSYEDPIEE